MILELIHAYGTDKLTVEESIGVYLLSEWSNYVSSSSESGYSSLGGQTICIYGSQYPVGGSSSGSDVAVAASFCLLLVQKQMVLWFTQLLIMGYMLLKIVPIDFPYLELKGYQLFLTRLGFIPGLSKI